MSRDQLAEAAGEEFAARQCRQHLGGGAAERRVAADVSGEGRGHEGASLVGDPFSAPDPAGSGHLMGAVARLAPPRPHGDLAHDKRRGARAVARRARFGGDDLDQPGQQRQSIRIERRAARIRSLPQPRHVANQRNRPHRHVDALQLPGGDAGVVDRAVEREVDLHVPLERVQRLPGAEQPPRRTPARRRPGWRSRSSGRAASPTWVHRPRARPAPGRSPRAAPPAAHREPGHRIHCPAGAGVCRRAGCSRSVPAKYRWFSGWAGSSAADLSRTSTTKGTMSAPNAGAPPRS